MSSPAVQEILEQIRRLAKEDRRSLAEELPAVLTESPDVARPLASARGLGKQVWSGIDAQDYVNQERNAWDG